MNISYNYIIFTLAYLMGSIPTGFLLGKIKNIDIRKHGSGNIGATNVTRTIGKKLGFFTLLFDSIKPIIALILANKLDLSQKTQLYIAFISIAGHIFPIWLKFNGGKGVATALSSLTYFDPNLGLLMVIIWLITFKYYKISALSSIIIFIILPLYSFVFKNYDFFIFSLMVSILVIVRHHKNISNLINNKENNFK